MLPLKCHAHRHVLSSQRRSQGNMRRWRNNTATVRLLQIPIRSRISPRPAKCEAHHSVTRCWLKMTSDRDNWRPLRWYNQAGAKGAMDYTIQTGNIKTYHRGHEYIIARQPTSKRTVSLPGSAGCAAQWGPWQFTLPLSISTAPTTYEIQSFAKYRGLGPE